MTSGHDIHREAIKRFLKRLDEFATALGEPSCLWVEIPGGELTRSGAESSRGRYEPGDIFYGTCLVVTVRTKSHATALLLGSGQLIKSAAGLFDALRIAWSDGDFGFSYAVPDTPDTEEANDL